MKGLLLKDWYQTVKYCRSYLVIVLVFLLLNFFSQEKFGFMVIYPFLLCGMIPVTLLSYDTASHWESMSLTLPYSRGQIVSGKYVLCLCIQGVVLLLTALTQTVKMCMQGAFSLSALLLFLMPLIAISLIFPTLMLPVIFRVGVEKGRMLYLCFIGVTFALTGIATSGLNDGNVPMPYLSVGGGAALLGIIVGLFIGSWLLSIRFYSKREF